MTQAEQVARTIGSEERWEWHSTALYDACLAMGAKLKRDLECGAIHYIFADGSAIISNGPYWRVVNHEDVDCHNDSQCDDLQCLTKADDSTDLIASVKVKAEVVNRLRDVILATKKEKKIIR